MKSMLPIAAFAATFAPVSAFAHAGGHEHVEGGVLAHMLASPFHAGIVVLALALAGYGLFRTVRPVRQESRRKQR